MAQTTQISHSESAGGIAGLGGGAAIGRIDADMGHVLESLAGMGARPLEMTTPAAARRQPGLGNAVARILARQGRGPGEDGVATEDIVVEGAKGKLGARVYRPPGLLSRLNPMVLYFHGGGWVTGDLDSHDATARALARRAGAIVVSAQYRLAPEARFPAAHEDADAVWKWLVKHARGLGGDPHRMAVAGEDGGASLAMNVALKARDTHRTQPVHQLLIHPIAGSDMSRPSYGEMARAQPVGTPAMQWRMRHALKDRAEMADPRIDLVAGADLAGVAPVTMILAEHDPLRSEGEALAEALEMAGVGVTCSTYEGVTQGFFGLGLIVTKALFAQAEAAEALVKVFSQGRRS